MCHKKMSRSISTSEQGGAIRLNPLVLRRGSGYKKGE
jgi:hypothetical protein